MPMESSEARSTNRWSWGLIGTMLLLFFSCQPDNPIVVTPATAQLPALVVLMLIGMRLVGTTRRLPNLVVAADALLQMTLFTLAGILLSHAIAARGGALWDARLARADTLLGLDWPALRALLDESEAIVWLLAIAYHSLIAQMIAVILVLAAVGKHAELRLLILAAILAGFGTILVSALVPALGNLFDAGSYRHLLPSVASIHADIVTGLRDGSLRVIDLRRVMGIVTFPSYHAALAILFIWALRQVPRTRRAGTALATLTILATPINGGHYGVDVLAGLLLGVLALGCARYASAPANSALLIASGRQFRASSPLHRAPP
jgi:hypothetical protein